MKKRGIAASVVVAVTISATLAISLTAFAFYVLPSGNGPGSSGTSTASSGPCMGSCSATYAPCSQPYPPAIVEGIPSNGSVIVYAMNSTSKSTVCVSVTVPQNYTMAMDSGFNMLNDGKWVAPENLSVSLEPYHEAIGSNDMVDTNGTYTYVIMPTPGTKAFYWIGLPNPCLGTVNFYLSVGYNVSILQSMHVNIPRGISGECTEVFGGEGVSTVGFTNLVAVYVS
jgi:hypothetical protein